MRPVELIPESIDVTNNGPEDLNLPYGVKVAKGTTVTVKLFQFAGGPSAAAGRNSGGTSLEPAALDSQSQTYSYVGAADPGPTAGIPIGGGAPRSTANSAGTGDSAAGAIAGPVHIEGDSPRQRLWNAIAAASYDGLATLKYATAATMVAGGATYAADDILTVVGGTYTTPATIKVLTVSKQVTAATKVAGGTGYTADDILTIVGGTSTTAAKIKVLTVTLGVVTTFEINDRGVYSVLPTGTVAVTGGTGADATFTLTTASGVVTTHSLESAGTYSVLPVGTVATTGETGTGATFTLATVDKIIALSNQVVGSSQPNIAVGGGSYFGSGLDLDTPGAKRTVTDDSTYVRSVNGTYGFNTAPRGGAAITSVRARS
jgi:hypothetical protein